jgi:hypothetical protein
MRGIPFLVLLFIAVRAIAGTPFGGDDAGFVPPDAATFACESTVEKHFAKLIGGTGACHVTAARMGVRGNVFDEEACEDRARARYDRATAGLAGCPSCLDIGAYAAAEVARIDTIISSALYCDKSSGRPLGDADDLGYVPADVTAARCQNRTARRLGHLAETLVGCHVRLAADAFRSGVPDGAAEDACEAAALAKYDAAVALLVGCPTCLDATHRASLGAIVVLGENVVVGSAYCASPGGAFLD